MRIKCFIFILTVVLITSCTNPFFPEKRLQSGDTVSISINPEEARILAGDTLQFYAAVHNSTDQNVNWYVEDNENTDTDIDEFGLLTVSADETAHQITVKAVYDADNTIYEEAVITIIGIDDLEELLEAQGETIIGETVIINTDNLINGEGSFIFQWYVDDIPIDGQTENSYTITGDNAGKVISCVVIYVTEDDEELAEIKIEIDTIVPFSIILDIRGNQGDDSVTADSNTGYKGDEIALNYTVSNISASNILVFNHDIINVTSAGSGTKTYTVNEQHAANGEITIIAAFTHTDKTLDPIAFTDTDEIIHKTYGDSFTNIITDAHIGTGSITYSSENPAIADVDDDGVVTIYKAGTVKITANKEADDEYAHASAYYELIIGKLQLTIGNPVVTTTKTYNGANTAAATAGTLTNKVGNDDVIVSITSSAYNSSNVLTANEITVVYSITGADAENYIKPVDYKIPGNIIKATGSFGNPAVINTTYTPTLTLANLTLPTGYVWNIPTTALSAGSSQFPATYTNPSGNYEPEIGNITVNISKAAGSFGSPAAISTIYTTALKLANLTLPAGYVWNVSSTALNAGNNQTFPATYTNPNGNYEPVIGNITVNIAKATGSFGSPAAVGTTYNPTLTLANLTLPAGYVWNAPATSLNAGNNQTFPATYTNPNGNYEPEIGNITVNISKAAGSFGSPAAVGTTYTPGLTLASLTLPAGYVWNVPSTALNAGNNQTFAATYTNPSGNYEPASGYITVNVEQKPEINLSIDNFSPTDAGEGEFNETIILNINNPVPQTINAPQGSTDISWYLDNIPLGSGNSISLNPTDYNIGEYTLYCLFIINSTPWMGSISVKVQ